jgi:hypothetical protein
MLLNGASFSYLLHRVVPKGTSPSFYVPIIPSFMFDRFHRISQGGFYDIGTNGRGSDDGDND